MLSLIVLFTYVGLFTIKNETHICHTELDVCFDDYKHICHTRPDMCFNLRIVSGMIGRY